MKKVFVSVLLCALTGVVSISAQTVLLDNGPLVTQVGAGANGADISELQTDLGMNTLGFGNQIPNDNRLADDFVIPPEDDEWNVTSITLFAYQTGTYSYPPVSTMNDVRVQISDGPPWDGGTVVWGDLTTNRMSETGWTGIQRVTDTTTQGNQRPIMYLQCDVDITLESGTYYLEWMLGGSGSSGPWYPPITIVGQTTTGDAYQHTSTSGWNPANDSGTLTQQGMPFILEGYISDLQGACDHFNRPDSTDVIGWTEHSGDWSIAGNRLQSQELDIWQYITFNGSSQQDGCVEGLAQYGTGSSVRFMGLTARWVNSNQKILLKLQDNNNSGYWDSYYLYDGTLNKYHQSGLNLGSNAKLQMEYSGSSVTLRIDTDLDGIWDIEHTVTGIATTGSGLTGASAYRQCYLDDWCFGSYCGDWVDTICPPGSIPEGEPLCHDEYEDIFNGGCNSSPYVFQDIQCGDVICGESGTYMHSGSQYRDTDWYRVEIFNATTLTWSVFAEFESRIFVINAVSENCADYTIIDTAVAAPLSINEISTIVSPGVYWLWVGPNVFYGVPCGAEYVATLSCGEQATPTPVATNTPTPMPTNTPTPVPTHTPTPACIKHGDVNLDGVVTAADAQLAFFIVLGLHFPTYEQECAADCNGDGVITAADAQAIFLKVLGQASCVDPL